MLLVLKYEDGLEEFLEVQEAFVSTKGPRPTVNYTGFNKETKQYYRELRDLKSERIITVYIDDHMPYIDVDKRLEQNKKEG